MPAQIGTTADVLMLNIQAQLVAFLGYPPERVVIDQRDPGDETLIAQAEQYVVLSVEDGMVTDGMVSYSGRLASVERLTFCTTLWTRCALDESTAGNVLMTDPSLGHLIARHALYDALTDYVPVDGSSNILTASPVHPGRATRPRRPKPKPGWAWSQLYWVAPYQLALNLSGGASTY